MIAEVVDTGPLRSTGTVCANRTDRASQNVSYGQFGVFCGSTLFTGSAISTCRQDTFFIGDRKGFEYQGDLKLGAFASSPLAPRPSRSRPTASRKSCCRRPPRDCAISRPSRQPARPSLPAPDHAVDRLHLLHLTFGGRIDNVLDVAQFETWHVPRLTRSRETGTKLRASAGPRAKAPSLFQLYQPRFWHLDAPAPSVPSASTPASIRCCSRTG